MESKSNSSAAVMDSNVWHTKNLVQVILERRATGHFTPEPVLEDDLNEILRLAAQAPSGYNLQPWRFIVVRDPDNRKRLQKAAFNQPKVAEAPVVVIAVGMKNQPKQWIDEVLQEGIRHGLGSAEKVQQIKDTALGFLSSISMEVWVNRHTMIAVTTMMWVAESLGYDTAPMEGFDARAVKEAFNIPEEGEVVALLAIGHGAVPDKKYPGRFDLDRIAFQERFGMPWPVGGTAQ